ncbi:hypothetical protein [Luteimonas aquatica]|uniref:hypothetical protein n=1 Tax=Luteimonas aquatica TaxID=450364 RepID=UPI001F5A1EFB|nr:hypothetical protein [Luteimonas aquatica]
MSQVVPAELVPYGGVAFLCGVFCAYWAQETGRSAWLWFFFGLLLPLIAAISLLSKNAVRVERRDAKSKGSP